MPVTAASTINNTIRKWEIMITVSLNEIRAKSPCESGWIKVLKSKGGVSADMDAQFPITDILKSNDLDDALWCLRCRPEYSNLWRKFAVWAARQVESQMADERSRNALDVAWPQRGTHRRPN